MRNLSLAVTIVCLTLCLCAVSYAKNDPSLVLYFDFEDGKGDTVTDRSQYGNDGTIVGDGIWEEGKIGGGLELTGGAIVLVPDCDEFHITEEVTLACWAKFESLDARFDFLVCRWAWATGNNRCYETVLDIGAPRFVLSSDGTDAGATGFTAPDVVETDRWYNIVGVFDGSKVIVYVDGEEIGSADHGAGTIVDGECPITIGDNNGALAPDYCFNGIIDEVAVYDRALSANEVKATMVSSHSLTVELEGKLTKTWGGIKAQY